MFADSELCEFAVERFVIDDDRDTARSPPLPKQQASGLCSQVGVDGNEYVDITRQVLEVIAVFSDPRLTSILDPHDNSVRKPHAAKDKQSFHYEFSL
jgi:hypothetical protein